MEYFRQKQSKVSVTQVYYSYSVINDSRMKNCEQCSQVVRCKKIVRGKCITNLICSSRVLNGKHLVVQASFTCENFSDR